MIRFRPRSCDRISIQGFPKVDLFTLGVCMCAGSCVRVSVGGDFNEVSSLTQSRLSKTTFSFIDVHPHTHTHTAWDPHRSWIASLASQTCQSNSSAVNHNGRQTLSLQKLHTDRKRSTLCVCVCGKVRPDRDRLSVCRGLYSSRCLSFSWVAHDSTNHRAAGFQWKSQGDRQVFIISKIFTHTHRHTHTCLHVAAVMDLIFIH